MKLIIANTNIHQDEEGRFSLNDLHKSAGGEERHRPNYFLENQQTKALVSEIEKAGIPAIAAKQKVGTFAAKELVYAYAMWISPSFHLQVIRAYDALATGDAEEAKRIAKVGAGKTPKALPNPVGTTRAHLLVVSAMQKVGVRKEMAMAVALQAIHDDTGISTEGYRLALPSVEDVCNLNQKQLGELLGISAKAVGNLLRNTGLMIIDEAGQRVITEKGRQFGEMKPFKAFNGHAGYEPRWNKSVIKFFAQQTGEAA